MLPIAFEFLMYAIAMFGFRMFDPIPLARQAVIVQMRDGVLVTADLVSVIRTDFIRKKDTNPEYSRVATLKHIVKEGV